jgi:hypothetical protein
MKPKPGNGGKWNEFLPHVEMSFYINLDQLIRNQQQKRKDNGVAKFHSILFANIRGGIEAN